MSYRIRFLLISVFLLSWLNTAQAANIIASVDRSQIFLDESFRVIFEADGAVDADPDFTPLRQDFEILSQSQSTNMSFVNGQYSRKAVWSLDLIAKRSGALTLPSVAFGKDQSPALRIQIKDPASAGKPAASSDKDVFIQVEIDESRAWVQSQIIYNVRLFSRISMSNLRSSEPETSDPDAIIKQLGEASSYEAFRDGVRYAVYEIRYAVFPQHSGKLEFRPMVFEGRVNRARSQSIFDQFMNTGELKRVRSNAISIEVAARPDNIHSTDWLPARNMTLTEEWSDDVNALKTGEPVTRTITITAHGNMAEHLPDPALGEISALKQYADKPLTNNKVTDQGVAGSKQIKVALIPTRAGDFKLPAITLPWWNTETGRQEVAVLPEKIITAHGVAAASAPLAPETPPVAAEVSSEAAISIDQMANIEQAGYWPWLSLVLGLSWLATLVALLRRNPAPTRARLKTELPPRRALEKKVQQYCRSNEAARTKDALLAWARACWPERSISNLADVSRNVSDELAAEIDALNATLYSSQHSPWQGAALGRAFKNFQPQKARAAQPDAPALEPLYK